MGWTSTGDPLANVGDSALSFESKEAAIEFAAKHGWSFTVGSPCLAIPLVLPFLFFVAIPFTSAVPFVLPLL